MYAQDETKEIHVWKKGKKKDKEKKKSQCMVIHFLKDDSSDHSPLNVKGDRLSS